MTHGGHGPGWMHARLTGVLGLMALVVVMVWILRSDRTADLPHPPGDAAEAELPPSGDGRTDESELADFKERLRRSPKRDTGDASPLATLLRQIADDDAGHTKLALPEIELFVASSRTNAESLLVAYAMSRDPRYLDLAAKLHPGNPMVALKMATSAGDATERLEWMKRFRSADPENSLPDYLMVREFLEQGDYESAWQALAEGAGKTGFHDYLRERIQSAEEAYLLSGRPPVEAKILAAFGVEFDYLSGLRGCAKEMAEAEQYFRDAGDLDSATRLAGYSVGLGQPFQHGSSATSLINVLVGMAIETDTLERWSASDQPGFDASIVAARLTELDVTKAQIKSDGRLFEDWMQGATEPEVLAYMERLKLYGEPAALEWLRNRAFRP